MKFSFKIQFISLKAIELFFSPLNCQINVVLEAENCTLDCFKDFMSSKLEFNVRAPRHRFLLKIIFRLN